MSARNMCRWLELEPVDAWFFGDGRPSFRGEDQSDLISLCPPPATTVVGGLRAALARSAGWSGFGDWPSHVKRVLGDGFDDLGQLTFTGPFFKKDGELLFPMPSHLLGTAEPDNGTSTDARRFVPLDWLYPVSVVTDANHAEAETAIPTPPPHAEARLERPEGWYVTREALETILAGRLPPPTACYPRDTLFVHEPRVGIALDSGGQRRSTGEGSLYSPQYVRLREGVSLAVAVDGLPEHWSVPAVFPLGGESRLAACSDAGDLALPASQPPSHGAGVLILLTPAQFEGEPWYGAGPGDAARRLDPNLSGRVATAALERPERIGGWDSRARRSRALAPFAPAGATWWLQEVAGVAQTDPGVGTLVSRAYGFGHALYGQWPGSETEATDGTQPQKGHL